MSAASTHVVLNPQAGSGRGEAVGRALASLLARVCPDHQLHRTTHAGEAVAVARTAAQSGARQVVAVGGDGTLHEVVNGVLQVQGQRPDVALVPAGRGSDFARGTGIGPEVEAAVELLTAPSRPVDVIRITSPRGVQYSINVAEVGLGGLVVDLTSRPWVKRLGKASYFVATIWSLARFDSPHMKVTWTGPQGPGSIEGRLMTVAVANSPFFGSGMKIAPGASPTDGLLNAVVIEHLSLWEWYTVGRGLYVGGLEGHPRVRMFTCHSLDVSSDSDVMVDADGEPIGMCPVRFEVVPGALNFKLPLTSASQAQR